MQENNFDNIPKSTRDTSGDTPGFSTSKESEQTLEEEIITLVSQAKWNDLHCKNVFLKWREVQLAELYNTTEGNIDEDEINKKYMERAVELFAKALNSIPFPEDKEKFTKFVEEQEII